MSVLTARGAEIPLRRLHPHGPDGPQLEQGVTTQVSETAAASEPHREPEAGRWVDEIAELTKPDAIHWCDGSAEEYDRLCQELVDAGTFKRLADAKRPNSYLAWSDPSDVARVEDRTFICSENEDDAGPNNNWRAPAEMRETMNELFEGAMKGRTMYVVPFSMGPLGSDKSHIGVQLTDSPYVVVSMRIMTRMGKGALDVLGATATSCRACTPSARRSARAEGRSVADQRRGQVHRPLPGDARDLVVRLGLRRQRAPRQEVLRAAHRLGHGARRGLARRAHADPQADLARGRGRSTSPGAFPSACGKTNLAMLIPTLEGWKVETVGDDIAWMKFGDDGRLYAINPEAGFFGVAPGTGDKTNPNAMDAIEKNTIFTNVALTDDGDVWWEGLTDEPPAHLIDWHGNDWTPESEDPAAHPNSRFTVPAAQAPVIAAEWEDPAACRSPRSSSAAAAPPRPARARGLRLGARRVPRRHDVLREDRRRRGRSASCAATPSPCCPSAATTWPTTRPLAEDRRGGEPTSCPKIFYVNWFRKDDDGRFLWPGFGENSRVLSGSSAAGRHAEAVETPIGLLPAPGATQHRGLGRHR